MTAEQHSPRRRLFTALGLRTALGLSAAACLTLPAAAASAQSASDRATAQALFDRAKKLMSEGKYAEACPALEESQRIESRSGTALNLADCYEQAGRLASAWSMFVEAATLAKATGNADRERGARERAAALAPRLSNLVISAPFAASTPGLEIMRDNQLVGSAQLGLPLPADAGTHTVVAKAFGRKPWQTTVTVQSGASTASVAVPDLERSAAAAPGSAPAAVPPVAGSPAGGPRAAVPPAAPVTTIPEQGPPSVTVAPSLSERAPAPAAASRLNGGVIAGGVVTGLLAAGTVVTGILYNAKLHDYDTANDQLAANRASLHSQTKTLGVANLALLGGTVVAAGITVFLWARAPSRETASSASVELRGMIGPGLTGLSLRGRL